MLGEEDTASGARVNIAAASDRIKQTTRERACLREHYD